MVTRKRVASAGLLLMLGGAVLFAQEQRRLENILITDAFVIGASVPFVMEGTTADAFEFTIRIDPTEDVTWYLPASAGTSGQQLQTNGVGNGEVLSWASAASSKAYKNLDGLMDQREALQTVLSTPIWRFHYKPDAKMSTQDRQTAYVGPLAEESPWAMHHNGQILNPINTAGYTVAAIQAQQQQIDVLKAELAALRRGR